MIIYLFILKLKNIFQLYISKLMNELGLKGKTKDMKKTLSKFKENLNKILSIVEANNNFNKNPDAIEQVNDVFFSLIDIRKLNGEVQLVKQYI
jgi:hypothetical protein